MNKYNGHIKAPDQRKIQIFHGEFPLLCTDTLLHVLVTPPPYSACPLFEYLKNCECVIQNHSIIAKKVYLSKNSRSITY